MRKPMFCICEKKYADQLRGNREADQRLSFRYIDSTFSSSSSFTVYNVKIIFELRHEKTNVLHMRKEIRRSASR